MISCTVRRRVRHEDVGGRKFEHLDSTACDGLDEPLLSREISGSSHRFFDVDEDCWKERRRNEELVWTHNVSQLLSQWAQCFSNVVIGSGSWLGGLLSRSLGKRRGNDEKLLPKDLSPLQEERLRKLQLRLQVPFDGTRLDHQKSFQRLLFKQEGKRATWEYPFAIAGINVSFMLIQMLDLYSARPKSPSGINFLKILSEDEMAFDVLYCVAFEMIDAQWLAMRASYMEFNEVLKVARTQLERELSLEDINQIQDLPAYNLLYQ